MAADKRSVTTDALETLGTFITPNEGRDAIHLAVENVVAAERLEPGQHVGFVLGGVGRSDSPVGIVDPFLGLVVEKGDHFWLVVYPRQITSLRHVWTHPAFPDAEPAAPVVDKSASEIWMRAWAMKHMGYDYYGDDYGQRSEESAYQFALNAGHKGHIGPYEDARDHIDSEWWGHWEAITGEKGDRDQYFSCAC